MKLFRKISNHDQILENSCKSQIYFYVNMCIHMYVRIYYRQLVKSELALNHHTTVYWCYPLIFGCFLWHLESFWSLSSSKVFSPLLRAFLLHPNNCPMTITCIIGEKFNYLCIKVVGNSASYPFNEIHHVIQIIRF